MRAPYAPSAFVERFKRDVVDAERPRTNRFQGHVTFSTTNRRRSALNDISPLTENQESLHDSYNHYLVVADGDAEAQTS
jgi:hypothetical protein